MCSAVTIEGGSLCCHADVHTCYVHVCAHFNFNFRGLIVSNSNSEEEGYGCGSKESNIPEGKSPWCHLRCFVALQYNSFCGLVACSGIVVIAILEQAFSS